MVELTHELLVSRLSYDALTGEFRWRKTGVRAGSINGQGYWRIHFRGRGWQAHRLAWMYVHGAMPDGQVDHINGVRSDNRIENLRVTGNAHNHRNMKRYRTNKSGTTGVSFNTKMQKWLAIIKVDGRAHFRGAFEDINEAIAARKAAEVEFGFHPNHGR